MEELYPVPSGFTREQAKAWRYQHKVVAKTCIECGRAFEQIRRLSGICSDECKAARRVRFRPPTFKDCKHCGKQFGPLDHLGKQYCSRECAYANRERTKRTVATKEARNAQSLLRYYIVSGKIVRPSACEECGATERKVEGAHFDYERPLDVRWLCRSCHAKWDKAEPKGGAYSVSLVTGQQATLERRAD